MIGPSVLPPWVTSSTKWIGERLSPIAANRTIQFKMLMSRLWDG